MATRTRIDENTIDSHRSHLARIARKAMREEGVCAPAVDLVDAAFDAIDEAGYSIDDGSFDAVDQIVGRAFDQVAEMPEEES